VARYIGPVCKLSRREGTDLFLKSARRSLDTKCKLDSRPGQHGAKSTRISEYGTQLREKQKIRRMYGVLERQFRTYFDKAIQKRGATGENLLQMLGEPPGQRRLPHGIRLHARRGPPARLAQGDRGERQAREHPSYLLRATDVVSVPREVARAVPHQGLARPRREERLPGWVEVDPKNFKGVFKSLPDRAEFANDVNEQLVVELYSK
jgi:small subunit ribosomal protein S4